MATRPCRVCAKPLVVSPESLPEPTCQPCRRHAWGLAPDRKVNDWKAERKPKSPRFLQCRRCDDPIPDGRVAYCSTACARKRKRVAKRSSAARGYGHSHQKLRAQLLPQAYGRDCHLCGAVMLPEQELHLDHTPDRTGYRGMAHAWCNARDGLERAQEALRRKRLGVSA